MPENDRLDSLLNEIELRAYETRGDTEIADEARYSAPS
jgi:hypothetical protein